MALSGACNGIPDVLAKSQVVLATVQMWIVYYTFLGLFLNIYIRLKEKKSWKYETFKTEINFKKFTNQGNKHFN